jgi:hypothetical protein
VRALVRRPDREMEFSDITVHTNTAMFEIRRRDVQAPQAGDIIRLFDVRSGIGPVSA